MILEQEFDKYNDVHEEEYDGYLDTSDSYKYDHDNVVDDDDDDDDDNDDDDDVNMMTEETGAWGMVWRTRFSAKNCVFCTEGEQIPFQKA